jgi:hypothetical protein
MVYLNRLKNLKTLMSSIIQELNFYKTIISYQIGTYIYMINMDIGFEKIRKSRYLFEDINIDNWINIQ